MEFLQKDPSLRVGGWDLFKAKPKDSFWSVDLEIKSCLSGHLLQQVSRSNDDCILSSRKICGNRVASPEVDGFRLVLHVLPAASGWQEIELVENLALGISEPQSPRELSGIDRLITRVILCPDGEEVLEFSIDEDVAARLKLARRNRLELSRLPARSRKCPAGARRLYSNVRVFEKRALPGSGRPTRGSIPTSLRPT